MKVIVHSGRAVFNTVGGLSQVSGTDVILAHRLLKNSVPTHEYLLMTETAYRDFGREMSGEFLKGEENCEGLGRVTTYVQFMGDKAAREREALYSLPADTFRSRLQQYRLWAGAPGPQIRATLEQLRNPIKPVGRLKRAAFATVYLFQLPFAYLYFRMVIPRRMFARKEHRARLTR